MTQIHIIRITTQGSNTGLVVNIYSDYLGQKIEIPIDNEPGDLTPAITTAKKYLSALGYTFSGYNVGKHGVYHYLVSDCFIPIK